MSVPSISIEVQACTSQGGAPPYTSQGQSTCTNLSLKSLNPEKARQSLQSATAPRVLTLTKGLRSHMNTVHPDKKALKMCHICSYKCILSSSLRIHIESVHDKVHPYTTYLITLKGEGGHRFQNVQQLSKNVRKYPKMSKNDKTSQ